LTIEGVTFRNGRAPVGIVGGGGILSSGPALTIQDSAFVQNEGGPGGGLHFTGEVLTVERTVFSENNGGDFGGGFAYQGVGGSVTIKETVISDNAAELGGGGIFSSLTELTISNSAVTRNSTLHTGGGLMIGGGRSVIADSEISGNRAAGLTFDGLGGGIHYCCSEISVSINGSSLSENEAFIAGGAVYLCCGASAVTREILNSTLSGNIAGQHGGGIETGFPLALANVTISGNRSLEGAGLAASQPVVVKNSIIAANPGGDCLSGPFISLGHNLGSDDTCALTGAGDITADPLLGPLADNGGPTKTRSLLGSSPAIDGGDPSGCSDFAGAAIAVDQRGLPRPRDGDGDTTPVCDIGAFELQEQVSATPSPSPSPSPGPSPSPIATSTPPPSSPTAAPAATTSPSDSPTPAPAATPQVLAGAAGPRPGGLPSAGGVPASRAAIIGPVGIAVLAAVIGGHLRLRQRRRER
jgi:hypothetical protein